MYRRSSWGRVFALACLLAFIAIGPYRIMQFLYQIGLYPTVSEREVISALTRKHDVEALTCQKNVAGWDYVCEYVSRDRSGAVTRHRDGIRTSWMTPIASQSPLRVDGPVQSPAEHAQWVKDEYKKLVEPVNLRTATVADLRRIPLVDQYRAEQIYAAVREGTVRGVDDLMKVKGIDQSVLSAMRPRVRWE